MKAYKVVQKIYNRTTEHVDLIETMDYTIQESDQEIVQYAVQYLSKSVSHLEFPGKSYAVALIYAYYIQDHFGTPFYESLDDPDLFDGTDRFFSSYSRAKKIYDQILEALPQPFCPNLDIHQVQKTYSFFQLEFGLQKS